MTRNRLSEETSPYLLQHADNPVHWYGWGPEALASAKEQDKPILLSVGYAACHWCHVMAHESFENGPIANQMNDQFINVKVDREERPDIDTIYQHALQLLGQQGGWPLTMFLTPDGEPFWGGTYFPPDSRYGRPGFPQVLSAISDYWKEKRDKALETAQALNDGLTKVWTPEPAEGAADGIPLASNDHAAARLAREFDMQNGGIGNAPKFPNPSIQELLWRSYLRTGNETLRDAVLLSLTKMSQGGIYDHLGGGYARYSTDAIWLVPHFEKMLYDNAQILELLTWVWQDTGRNLFSNRIKETADWLLREMVAENGAFAATLDADSEGTEGKYYVWDESEIEQVLGAHTPLFKGAYDITPEGNWEGKNILNRTKNKRDYSQKEEELLEKCRQKLLRERQKRVRPGWDDKILADWNGLMITALANASVVFKQTSWLEAATRAYDFILNKMNNQNTLSHAYRAGLVNTVATLDDYAGMIRASLTLNELTGEQKYIENAQSWITTINKDFWDKNDDGYYFTPVSARELIVRTKSASDNATPGGNSVMAANLAKLYYLTGKHHYRERAEAILLAFSGELASNFFPFATLLNAAEFLQSAVQIAIIGNRKDKDCIDLLSEIYQQNLINKVITVIPPGGKLAGTHPAFGKTQVNNSATVYICQGTTCSLPITTAKELKHFFRE